MIRLVEKWGKLQFLFCLCNVYTPKTNFWFLVGKWQNVRRQSTTAHSETRIFCETVYVALSFNGYEYFIFDEIHIGKYFAHFYQSTLCCIRITYYNGRHFDNFISKENRKKSVIRSYHLLNFVINRTKNVLK